MSCETAGDDGSVTSITVLAKSHTVEVLARYSLVKN